MKSQNGYLTLESGKWLGHYSRWVIDAKTGQKKRQQRAFVIAPARSMTKVQASPRLPMPDHASQGSGMWWISGQGLPKSAGECNRLRQVSKERVP